MKKFNRMCTECGGEMTTTFVDGTWREYKCKVCGTFVQTEEHITKVLRGNEIKITVTKICETYGDRGGLVDREVFFKDPEGQLCVWVTKSKKAAELANGQTLIVTYEDLKSTWCGAKKVTKVRIIEVCND